MTSSRCTAQFRVLVLAFACAASVPRAAAADAAGVAAPAELPVTSKVPAATLYARLGGSGGIRAIASSLIDAVANDPRLGRTFKDTNLERIKRLLGEQLCELTGGPCHYSGDPMRESHAGQHISEAEFYGMVSALERILAERHVSTGATNELLRLLAPMKRDIVEPMVSGAR